MMKPTHDKCMVKVFNDIIIITVLNTDFAMVKNKIIKSDYKNIILHTCPSVKPSLLSKNNTTVH